MVFDPSLDVSFPDFAALPLGVLLVTGSFLLSREIKMVVVGMASLRRSLGVCFMDRGGREGVHRDYLLNSKEMKDSSPLSQEWWNW